jgi:hypothetical protein
MVCLPYIDPFCETWYWLDGHCPIEMDLHYYVQTTCSFAQFFRLPFFLKYHLLGSIIVAPSFLVFSHEVLMDKMSSSLFDGMPICNQWNVEKHVSVINKIALAAA